MPIMESKTFVQSDKFSVSFDLPKDWVSEKGHVFKHKPYKKYLRTDLKAIFESKGITDPYLKQRECVAMVYPFKINQHIIDSIDWDHYQFDALFQLTFPQPGMLLPDELKKYNLK